MREFLLPLKGFVEAGLRHAGEAPPGAPGLVLAQNLRPSPVGLRAPYSATVPGLTGMAWPFPQLLPTYQGKVLAMPTALYSWSGPGGTPSALVTGLTAGGPWSLADFFTYAVATNGTHKASRSPSTGLWSRNTDALIPTAGVLATFNGQLFAGDLPANWCTNAGPNWVAWARPGTTDFTVDESNLAGVRPTLPYMGKVQALRQLGEHFMAYGESGVAYLPPITSPTPTFGLREMPFAGVAGRLAVAGGKEVHYFVDSAGDLWRLTDNHEILWLGYREFFQPLMAGGITLTFNRQGDQPEEVIISGSDRHYIYSNLAKSLAGPIMQPVSGGAYLAGSLVLVSPVPVPEDDQALIVTDTLDMDKRSLKTLEWAELVGSSMSGVELAADYRYSESGEWARTPWVPAGPAGVARIGVTALEIRLCARFTPGASTVVTGVKVRWKNSDKRFSRGAEGLNWGPQAT